MFRFISHKIIPNRIRYESYKYITTCILIISLGVIISSTICVFFFSLILLIICYFFRCPRYLFCINSDQIVFSPGCGKIDLVENISIGDIQDEEIKNFFPKDKYNIDIQFSHISMFLSIFDEHFNVIPISGIIKEIRYVAANNLYAKRNKSRIVNERNIIYIEDKFGNIVIVVQIAGILARRIRSYVQKGQFVTSGFIFGMIEFSSRVDIYVPKQYETMVKLGEKIGINSCVAATDYVLSMKPKHYTANARNKFGTRATYDYSFKNKTDKQHKHK